MLTSAFLTPLHMHVFSVHKLLVDDIEALHSDASARGVQWVGCVSLHAASQVLEKHEDEFFEVVDAKHNLHRLKRKKVITDHLIMEIENTDKETAKELLFYHLHHNADVATLSEYCKMVMRADAFPKMQTLGEKMLSELPPEGLLEWCVCIRVC